MNMEDYLDHMRESWAAQNKQAQNGRKVTNNHQDDSATDDWSDSQEPEEDE